MSVSLSVYPWIRLKKGQEDASISWPNLILTMMDGWMDRQTDKPPYRDVRTHLTERTDQQTDTPSHSCFGATKKLEELCMVTDRRERTVIRGLPCFFTSPSPRRARCFPLFRCVLASQQEGVSVRRSVRRSVRNQLFSKSKNEGLSSCISLEKPRNITEM